MREATSSWAIRKLSIVEGTIGPPNHRIVILLWSRYDRGVKRGVSEALQGCQSIQPETDMRGMVQEMVPIEMPWEFRCQGTGNLGSHSIGLYQREMGHQVRRS